MVHVERLLRRVRLRLAAAAAVEDLQRGLALGGGASLVTVAASHAGAAWATSEFAALAGATVALGVPAACALVRRVDGATLAAHADAGLGLRERLSTALWCASSSDDRGPLDALVVADAESVAALVPGSALAHAFRPRLLRRPLLLAAATLVCTGALLAWQPAAVAVESPQQKAARLAEADRVAQVARKLAEAAKRVEADAIERKELALAKAAAQARRTAEEMQKLPPSREAAMTKLNKLADDVRADARREAGLRDASEATPEAAAQDKALADLLRDLSEAGLESLQKDLAALEKRLQEKMKAAKAGDPSAKESGPTQEDIRDLASRVDALRRAAKRAEEAGASEVAQALRNLGNDDVLEKISERLRKLAAKMDQTGYEGLEEEEEAAGGESGQMDEMSREELEDLLKQLEQLEGMDDLSEMLQQGGQAAGRGKSLKIGFGRGKGKGGGKGGGKSGSNGSDGDAGGTGSGGSSGSSAGAGGTGNGMGGPGQGQGGKASFGTAPDGSRTEVARGRLDAKGRMTVTNFRGLPKPGELTVEDLEVLRAAREDAQAPLESEQIPRRYREGIRSWFDTIPGNK